MKRGGRFGAGLSDALGMPPRIIGGCGVARLFLGVGLWGSAQILACVF
jgi:hypothetical protein